jgi:hypothetical protein
MATVTGQSGVVKINLHGQAVALVGEVRSFTMNLNNALLEVTKMGDTGRNYTPSLDESDVSIDCYWDEADAQQLVLDPGAKIDFELSPSGTASGSKKYTGTAFNVSSKSITASFDGMVEASFSFQGGTVAEGAHS